MNMDILTYMKETTKVIDKITLDGLEYLREADDKWKNQKVKLYEAVSYLTNIRKRRPKLLGTLVRLSFEATSDDSWITSSIPYIAASSELLLNSTYAIDDILDNQPERHSKEAVWKKYGLNLGILLGYLQDNIAKKILREGVKNITDEEAKIRILDLYDDTVRNINEGQFLNEFMKDNTTVEFYLERTNKIGGIHYENLVVMSTIVAKANNEEIELLKEIGNSFGMAVMIRNDLFNLLPQEVIEEKQATALKRTSYEDLKKGLWTFPIIFAINNGDDKSKEKIRFLLGNKETSSEELINGTIVLAKCGALDATIDKIDIYRNKIKRNLEDIRESRAKSLFYQLDSLLDNSKLYINGFKEMFM